MPSFFPAKPSAPPVIPQFVVPAPAMRRWAAAQGRSVAADFALVTFNCLFVRIAAAFVEGAYPLGIIALREAMLVPASWWGIALLQATLITLWGQCEGLYATPRFDQQVRAVAKAVTASAILLGVFFWLQGPAPWIALGAASLLHFVALSGQRWIISHRQSERRSQNLRNVLVVGAGEVGQQLAAHVRNHPEAGRSFCGFLDDHRPLGDSVIGRVGNLARVARSGFVDEVILAIPHDRARTLWVLQESRRLRLDVEMVLDLFGCTAPGVQVEQVAGLPVVCLHAEHLPAAALHIKRYMDVVGQASRSWHWRPCWQ
jgi:FlaA1/EpsC-like NDP-sugar epimerase